MDSTIKMKPGLLTRIIATGMAATLAAGCSLTISDDDDDNSPASVAGDTVQASDFDSIALTGPDNVVVKKGDRASWRVEGDEDVVKKVRVKVANGTLEIGRRSGNWVSWDDGKATIYVTVPQLNNFSLTGSGDADIESLSGEQAALSIAGSGTIKAANIDVEKLELGNAGSGDIELAGSANMIDANIAGSGSIEGEKLKVNSAELSIAGSGDIMIASDGDVEASSFGSGDITVVGDAKCSSSSVGSGEIRCSGS